MNFSDFYRSVFFSKRAVRAPRNEVPFISLRKIEKDQTSREEQQGKKVDCEFMVWTMQNGYSGQEVLVQASYLNSSLSICA